MPYIVPPNPPAIVVNLPHEASATPPCIQAVCRRPAIPERLQSIISPIQSKTSEILAADYSELTPNQSPNFAVSTFVVQTKQPISAPKDPLNSENSPEKTGIFNKEFEFKVPFSPSPSLTPPQANRQQQLNLKKPALPPQIVPNSGKPNNSKNPQGLGSLIEVTADRQEYDQQHQIVTAEGKVMMRFQQALLEADRVQINVQNRIAVAEGKVSLRRGQQILQGDRFEYYFTEDRGTVLNASGEIYAPKAATDLAPTLANDAATIIVPNRPLSMRIAVEQPLEQISTTGGYVFGLNLGRTAVNLPNTQAQSGGKINRFRFQSERLDFDITGWRATNIRITNDAYSPPELELRASTAKLRQITPEQQELTTSRSRIVFDQHLAIPIFQNRRVIGKRERQAPLVNIGFDGTDRGGLFIEHPFTVLDTAKVQFTITPQYFIQRAYQTGNYLDPSVFGLKAKINADFSPRTQLIGYTELSGLNPDQIENQARASLRFRQTIGKTLPHNLALEYSYRDRLFNGSLGFQTVQSSLGAVLTSPVISLGKTGITVSYQGGIQYINADTDKLNLLNPIRTNNRVDLARYQASVSVNKGFLLWSGKGLPATRAEGLRYTPAPVVPYVTLATGITGVTSLYGNGDTQNSLSGNLSLLGQFGHFSRPFLDYTAFNLTYSEIAPSGISPFLFDRIADNRILSGGITQQLWGPLRLGFQTALNLDNSQQISTDYVVEYIRRTYGIMVRYNPVLQTGAIRLQINDFNWVGSPGFFDSDGISPVIQGVKR